MSSLALDDRGVIVPCRHCGKHNRVAYERLGQNGRCAECHRDLPPAGEPIDVSDENALAALTSRSALPVLIDFWAPWCGPCKMMAPELARVAESAAGEWIVAKLNTEDLPQAAQRFGITAIPLLVLFRGEREVAREAGARPAAGIREFVQQHL